MQRHVPVRGILGDILRGPCAMQRGGGRLDAPPPQPLRDQCPARLFHFGRRTMLFGFMPPSLSVSILATTSPFSRSMIVMDPSLIPGRFRSAFWTKAYFQSWVNAM